MFDYEGRLWHWQRVWRLLPAECLAQKTCGSCQKRVSVTLSIVWHLFLFLGFSLITNLKWNFVYISNHVENKKKILVLTRKLKTQLVLSQYVFKCNASVICHKYLTLLSSSAKLMPRSKSYSWVDDSTAVSEQRGASIFWFLTPLRTCQRRQHFPLKRFYLSTRLHDVTFHYLQMSPPGVHKITLICLALRLLMSYIYIYIYIYIYDISCLRVNDLTFILLTWKKWSTPKKAADSRWDLIQGLKG